MAQVNLSRLREIGWSTWNPIGLTCPPATPADEYDTYLMHVARLLMEGCTISDAAAYLRQVAEEQMGVPADTDAATNTCAAISAYVASLMQKS